MHVLYRDRESSLSADAIVLADAESNVLEVVLRDYDLPKDVRATAQEAHDAAADRLDALRARPPRSRLRRALSSVKQSLLWRRRFHATAPAEITQAFPDLGAI
jgi:hypothetical protein